MKDKEQNEKSKDLFRYMVSEAYRLAPKVREYLKNQKEKPNEG